MPISVLMSTIYGLTGFDTIRSECLSKPVDDNSPDEACEATNGLNDLTMNKPHEALSEAPQKDTQDCSSEHPKSLGVDNKGLDSDEADLRPCHPECNTGRKVEEVLSSKSTPDLLEMNCGLSPETMANSKPESAIPVTPAPKTARAWLKDPHLYKVITISHVVYKGPLKFKIDTHFFLYCFFLVGGHHLHMYKGFTEPILYLSTPFSYLQSSV